MSAALRLFHPAGEMASPHLPSIEALALAIEVQGSHAPDHLLRARLYAVELARRLGLDQAGLEMLQLAAILQDVGELAVPQSILSKPDGLTPQEFEKMKTHARVGALIVECAGLPRPAARMVRSHHERWDGTGYPDGRRREAIPLGARILAVADCLAGAAAGAALEALRAGNGTVFDRRLRDLVAYDCIAVYRMGENRLTPAYVNGESAQLFCSLEIPSGEGPSGVAAATRQPVLNGNPWADAAHGQAPDDTSNLRSTLAIPLESGGEVIAVLALYHAAPHAFGSEDLRILLAISGKLSLAVEHALHEERADQLAAVDNLTGLPNRRALFQRLDAELARCRRSHATLALLVCEIEGLPRIHRPRGASTARRLYQDIASGLRRMCREDDCVARMGEGFVLALGGFSARDLPEKQRLIEALLAELVPSDSGAPPLVPRIGAAYYPDDGAYAEDLLACADLRLSGVLLR